MAKQQLLLPCWPGGRGQSALRRSVLGHYQGLAGGRGVDTLNIERSLILTSSSANISDCLNFKMNLFSDDKLGLYGLVHNEIGLFHDFINHSDEKSALVCLSLCRRRKLFLF